MHSVVESVSHNIIIAQWSVVREDALLQLYHVYASHDHLYHEVCELMA